jgi:hypothetical protein
MLPSWPVLALRPAGSRALGSVRLASLKPVPRLSVTVTRYVRAWPGRKGPASSTLVACGEASGSATGAAPSTRRSTFTAGAGVAGWVLAMPRRASSPLSSARRSTGKVQVMVAVLGVPLT